MQKRCKFINQKTGERCGAFALESGFCFSHDPNLKKEKARAIKKGGLALKRIKLNLSPVKIRTAHDVTLVLEEVINLTRSGELPCSNPANTIGFLCNQILKSIELNNIETEVSILKKVISQR